MKRLLVVMRQPPGCSGVQALIYNKLLPFFDQHGWQVHFAGPAPWLVSVITEQLDYPPERLHYTTQISYSLRFSVRKNRHPKRSLSHLAYGVLQLLARNLERLTKHDSEAFLLRGLGETVREVEARWSFDLLAGKTPDFQVLELTQQLSQAMGKPFLALIDDPHGARDEQGFYPKDPDLQQAILGQASGALFMSPLTKERYVNAGLLERAKAHCITDSYPVATELYVAGRSTLARGPAREGEGTPHPLRLVYLGMLPEWRPIEPFLDAFRACAHPEGQTGPAFELAVHGFVYPSARKRITADPRLAAMIQLRPMVSYAASHALAADADGQLVVIGPRHRDNVPSKFFEYLGHRKPMLILGPPLNPLRELIAELPIGVYADGRSAEAIFAALQTLQANYAAYQQAYRDHARQIEAFSAPRVAEQFCGLLDQVLDPALAGG